MQARTRVRTHMHACTHLRVHACIWRPCTASLYKNLLYTPPGLFPLPGNPRLAAVYRFPRYTPPGLFETLTVRTQKSALRLTPLYHWRGGMCVLLPSHKPVLLYLLRIHHHDDGSACLRLEVCYQHKTAGDMEVETLWSVLLPFLEETEALLATFKGRSDGVRRGGKALPSPYWGILSGPTVTFRLPFPLRCVAWIL